ncbi:MAG: DUF4442 domain-containing protein [Bacteroidetes bacterium]|nr:DUF4442 domain-containing protein [Bacteroidota bacterium]
MPQTKFQKLVNNSFLFRLYLLKSLPMAFIAGVRVEELSDSKATTVIKFGWLTQNPFRSMYFACQAMAAEMSTGLLVMNHTFNSSPSISMLIVKNQAVYFKKAVGKIVFTCNEGVVVQAMIAKAKSNVEGVTQDLKSIGIDESGDIVSEFIFTWSVKAK